MNVYVQDNLLNYMDGLRKHLADRERINNANRYDLSQAKKSLRYTPKSNDTVARVVAKGDAREVGDHELELFQISQSTSLPGLSVNFFR